MKNYPQITDIRQTKLYANFMKKIGWQTKNLEGNFIYIKKLVFFSIIKILKPPFPISTTILQKLKKEFNPLFVKIQPAGLIKKTLSSFQKTSFFLKVDKFPIIPTKTIWINLKKNTNQLLKEMKTKTRYNIRLAQKRKVKIEIIKGEEISLNQLRIFYHFWKKNKPFNFFFHPSFKELKSLVFAFKKNCFFVFSYHPSYSYPLSGLLVLTSPNAAFYWHNFATPKGKKLFAPTLTTWQAILESQKRGLQIFDFEGIYDERFPSLNKGWQGFSRFKRGFGGQEIEFPPPLILSPFRLLTLINI